MNFRDAMRCVSSYYPTARMKRDAWGQGHWMYWDVPSGTLLEVTQAVPTPSPAKLGVVDTAAQDWLVG